MHTQSTCCNSKLPLPLCGQPQNLQEFKLWQVVFHFLTSAKAMECNFSRLLILGARECNTKPTSEKAVVQMYNM